MQTNTAIINIDRSIVNSINQQLTVTKKLLGDDLCSNTEQLVVQGPMGGSLCAFSSELQYALIDCRDSSFGLLDLSRNICLRYFLGHNDRINSLAFSLNRLYALSGSDDCTARLWDIRTGKELLCFRFDTAVYTVAFSPDCRRIVTITRSKITFWDLIASEIELEIDYYGDHGTSAVFSPDGQMLLTGIYSLALWDTNSGESLMSFKSPHETFHSVAISPDGTKALSGGFIRLSPGSDDYSSRGLLYLWDIKARKLIQELKGHERTIKTVAFSADSQIALSSGSGKELSLWDINAGICLKKLQTKSCTNAVFNDDCTQIVVKKLGGGISVLNVDDGTEAYEIPNITAFISAVDLSKDQNLIAVASGDSISILNIQNAQISQLVAHTKPVNSVAFDNRGRFLLSGSADKTIRLWDVSARKTQWVFEEHSNGVISVCFSPDNQLAASADSDGKILVWNVESRKTATSFKSNLYSVNSLCFSPDGKYLLSTGSEAEMIELWDIKSERAYLKFESDWIDAAAFSPSGENIIAAEIDSISIWTQHGHVCDLVTAIMPDYVKFSSNGLMIAGGGSRGLEVFDFIAKKSIWNSKPYTGSVTSLAFMHDDSCIVSGDSKGRLIFWDILKGKELARCHFFKDGTWAVTAPDGRYDSSDNGACRHLRWTVDQTSYPIEKYKHIYYKHGILKELLCDQ